MDAASIMDTIHAGVFVVGVVAGVGLALIFTFVWGYRNDA